MNQPDTSLVYGVFYMNVAVFSGLLGLYTYRKVSQQCRRLSDFYNTFQVIEVHLSNLNETMGDINETMQNINETIKNVMEDVNENLEQLNTTGQTVFGYKMVCDTLKGASYLSQRFDIAKTLLSPLLNLFSGQVCPHPRVRPNTCPHPRVRPNTCPHPRVRPNTCPHPRVRPNTCPHPVTGLHPVTSGLTQTRPVTGHHPVTSGLTQTRPESRAQTRPESRAQTRPESRAQTRPESSLPGINSRARWSGGYPGHYDRFQGGSEFKVTDKMSPNSSQLDSPQLDSPQLDSHFWESIEAFKKSPEMEELSKPVLDIGQGVTVDVDSE